MTTIIGLTPTADFGKIEKYETAVGQPASFTSSEPADFPDVPISIDSPLFKLAVLISRCFERLFGPASFSPDLVEGEDSDYPMAWPCCS